MAILRHYGVFLFLGILMLISSCSVTDAQFNVLQGNYAYGQGNYQDAIVEYLGAFERQEFAPWVSYNLANVYRSLGELDSAQRLWSDAVTSGDPDLIHAVEFNRGVLLYEQGLFAEAYQAFKQALILKPDLVAAKRNLELSLRKIQGSRSITVRDPSATSELAEGSDDDTVRLFEYVRRKEEQQWSANTNQETVADQEDW